MRAWLAAEGDQIFEFDVQDIIDLSPIDAKTRLAGDQAFRLVSAFNEPDACRDTDVGQMTPTLPVEPPRSAWTSTATARSTTR